MQTNIVDHAVDLNIRWFVERLLNISKKMLNTNFKETMVGISSEYIHPKCFARSENYPPTTAERESWGLWSNCVYGRLCILYFGKAGLKELFSFGINWNLPAFYKIDYKIGS